MAEREVRLSVQQGENRDYTHDGRLVVYFHEVSEISPIVAFVAKGCMLTKGDIVAAVVDDIEANAHIMPDDYKNQSVVREVALDIRGETCEWCSFGGLRAGRQLCRPYNDNISLPKKK